MSQHKELNKSYDFSDVEEKWLKTWEEQHCFEAAMEDGKPAFSIVIPPPNVTGVLHVGHALNNTLQDILTRYHRMCGDNTLWLPGTDHAGIATQNVVERQLAEEGKSRHDLGRDEFIERVWEWRTDKGGTIINQLKKLGCSCDWSRERFTMDEGLSKAVREVFVKLYKEGLIYKGDYIVNWCPRCLTALADDEVGLRVWDPLMAWGAMVYLMLLACCGDLYAALPAAPPPPDFRDYSPPPSSWRPRAPNWPPTVPAG